MRLPFTTLVLVSLLTPCLSAFQSRGSAATGKSTIHACSLLTRELIREVTPYEGKAVEVMFTGNREEDSLGAGGSDCSDGGMSVQIDPRFSIETLKREKDWERAEHVSVGDEALFHDNIGEWAELVVRKGSHLLAIRMDIPRGKTAASIKPNVVALANAILPALK